MYHLRYLLLVVSALFSAFGCDSEPLAPIYDGAALYAGNCSNCHGVYGEGNGAATPSLSVVMQDLRYITQRNDGEFPTEFVRNIIDGRETRVAHGPEGMPVWGNVFARQEGADSAAQVRVVAKVESLVEFLESIQINDED